MIRNDQDIRQAGTRARTLRGLFASAAVLALTAPTAAFAQDAAAEGADEADAGEIIVTARRSDERLQDVPVSVQAISGDSLQKLAITSVEEISKLAPGLTLVNAGSSTSVTLRGVTWQPASGTPATPIYFNEVPFDPGNTIVSLFDVGQIEVLRGPQGTSRGAPSISGAVTITTKKPDTAEFGGFVQGLYGSGDHRAIQAGINVPIVNDILAVRLAANIEDSDANRVYSVNSASQPKFKDRSYRATVLLTPTDTLSFQAMYQRRKTLTKAFAQVVGSGSPGFAGIPGFLPAIPANFNGPALELQDRASVQDQSSRLPQHIDLLTFNAKWEVLGHNLSYNYGRQYNRSPVNFNAEDVFNILPGFERFTTPAVGDGYSWRTHEIRLSSTPNSDRPFDYDIGWFSKHSDGLTNFGLPNYTPGAFGAPFQTIPGQVAIPNPLYNAQTSLSTQIQQAFDSFYGNVRFHFGDNTELSGGLAIIRDRVSTTTAISTSAVRVAFPRFLPAASGGCPLALFPNSTEYGANFCQLDRAASTLPTQFDSNINSKALYNFTLSHKFSEDVLAYATTGSSYRSGLASIGNAGLPAELVVPNPETAKSYEIGVKVSVGRNMRINAAVFQLDYKDQLTSLSGVRYFSAVPGANNPTSSNISFYGNVDAKVRGFELEVAATPIDNLSLSANLSYSKIKSQGGTIPCTAATPLTAANPVNFCPVAKGDVLNTEAPFQASINGGYEVPITEAFDGYLRFNVNYKGKNPNFGNLRAADGSFRKTDSYALVDLFAGVNGHDGAWEIGAYAKNVFDKQVELTRTTPSSPFAIFPAPAGYGVVRTNLPREIGVSLRYAFGSR